MVKLFIENKTKYEFKYERYWQEAAKWLIDHLNIKGDSEINIIIIDNNKIKKLSNDYKKKNAPTDVLSFPGEWKVHKELLGYNMFGDIFISFEKVLEQSKTYNHSELREWTYLFVHAFLHLIGYDHQTTKEEKIMNDLAKKVMEEIKVGRNA